MFAICTEPNLIAKGYRKAKIKDYLAIYKIDDNMNTVTIMRFFYGAMNYYNLL